MNMLPAHWFMLLIVLMIGYAIGARYPSTVPLIGKS